MITPSHADAAKLRFDDLIANATRHRLIAAATQPEPGSASPPASHIRRVLRHAVAALAAFAAVG